MFYLALLVLTFPGIQEKECAEEKPDLEILLLRPILLGLISISIIYAHTAKWNTAMFDTRAQESIVSETDLISGNEENLITQNFVANDTRELEELTLKFKNTLDGRVNMAMLSIKLIDSENAQCIYQNQIGCSSISNDVDLKIDLKKTKVITIIAGIGMLVSLAGFFGIVWTIVMAITGHTVAGLASIIYIVCFMSGIQMLSMGVIGTYIGKTYMETKHRPLYIISEKTWEPYERKYKD